MIVIDETCRPRVNHIRVWKFKARGYNGFTQRNW